MGNSEIKPHKREIPQRSKNYRSILASENIKKGEKLTISNIALKRSLSYQSSLSSKHFYKIIGKKAKKNIREDEKILFKKIRL